MVARPLTPDEAVTDKNCMINLGSKGSSSMDEISLHKIVA